ncbi:unnamed protein product [Scytosiphon promiscuus]
MGKEAFLLGLAVAPLAFSSAFVPPAGAGSSTFVPTNAPTAAARVTGSSAAARLDLVPASLQTMAMTKGSGEVEDPGLRRPRPQEQQAARGSRGEFVWRVSTAGVTAAIAGAAAVGGLGAGVLPALADSTGKYSSKATAKKRYLPRIVKLVSAFQLLKKDIASGSASAKSEFFVDLLPDSVSAMDLYGSSMKKGEMPDSKSKALQQLAKDFGATCASIGKSLGKKGGEADAEKVYDKASDILVQYLKGVELDPLGSDVYN